MSASKWAYDPQKCDGDFCIGECDLCSKKYEEKEQTNVGDDKQHGSAD